MKTIAAIMLILLIVFPVIADDAEDPGLKPTKALILKHLKQLAKDFDSIKELKIDEPRVISPKFFLAINKLPSNGTFWEIKITMNAKNSFGAYTGIKDHYLLIRNGEFVAFDDKAAMLP